MKKIKYFSFYALPDNKEKRVYTLSAVNKMDYIIDTLVKNGYFVEIVSASITSDSKKGYPKSQMAIKDGVTLKYLRTYRWSNYFFKVLSIIRQKLGILLGLLSVKRGETCIVYHSLAYMKEVNFAHKLKKFRLILECEEIYSDVTGKSAKREKEIKFIKNADGYIFPTELLDEKLNINGKKSVVIYGTYDIQKNFGEKFDDGKIHCVYAGTLDKRKGAFTAINSALYLDGNYHLHILGFGTEKEKNELLKAIELNKGKTDCKITFEGVKSGEEYIRFIQKCHIGLSTQDVNAEFNDTSFPSKILSYLSNGLNVVSVKISAIERSKVGKYLYFYEEQTPENIALAIRSVKTDREDGKKIVSDLDKKFTESINAVLA